MNFEIEYDQYTFFIEVTHYHYQKPLGRWADSDVDCYGYEDLEWKCDSVEEYFEDGSIIREDSEMKRVVELYSELLEDKILDKMLDEIEMMREDSYED